MLFFYPECGMSLNQYFKEISSIPILSEAEELELGNKAARGDLQARNTLVNSHLKYVVSIAKTFAGKGVELADLISEGNIGLLFAVEEFDPQKGRFSTYASYWIKKAMYDAIKEQSGITQAENKPDRFEDYKDKLRKHISNRYRKNEKEIEPFAWINEVLSLDQPLDAESEVSISDFLADESANPEDIIIANSIEEKIKDILSGLSEMEKVYVVNYFGLEGNKPMTIEEIADAYKMPVGKVSRTIKNTLRTLRINEKVKELRGIITE